MTNYNDTSCRDCGVETNHLLSDSAEWYMVWDKLWPNGIDFLCIGCLEDRLGRLLVPGDFNDCLLNRLAGYNRSLRLRSRMGITYE
jgi:hypothetical protein